MKRRIYWSLILTALGVLLITGAAALFLYYHTLETETRENIRNECELVASGLDSVADNAGFLKAVHPAWDNARITLIRTDGSVAFDSRADETVMENHTDRPEFQSALSTPEGRGEAIRHSATQGQDTYYFAKRLSDGTVLRFSYNTNSILTLTLSVLPLFLFLTAVIFLICALLARSITRRIVTPLADAGERLDDLENVDCYDEISPFLHKLGKQNAVIRAQLAELREERDTVSIILENMKEGLVLLDPDKRILSVNSSGAALLSTHYPNGVDYSSKYFVELTRSVELLDAVEQAVRGENATGLLQTPAHTLQYIASPVLNHGQVGGELLFLLDVTEQRRAQVIREEFSANVSHELKTPLTSITGFAELLKDGMVKNGEETQKFASLIYTESRRLLSLIDDVLRLSEIEEGRDASERVSVNLADTARVVVQNLAEKAVQREVRLELEAEDAVLPGNPGMLAEMLQNLIENAVKYNRAGGRVDVRIRRLGNRLVLSVEDNGIGIPREHHERIFERFYRVDKSRSKQTGGTGLGLSIVKHIVEFHHGEIQLWSRETVGTKITVTFPV